MEIDGGDGITDGEDAVGFRLLDLEWVTADLYYRSRHRSHRIWKGRGGRCRIWRRALLSIFMVVALTTRHLAASNDEDDGLRSRQIWNHNLVVELLDGSHQPPRASSVVGSPVSHVGEDGVGFGCMIVVGDEDDGGIELISSSPCFRPDRIVHPHDRQNAHRRQPWLPTLRRRMEHQKWCSGGALNMC
ncbi:hypothetical protein ACLOJK_034393 [Asimina triloba]